MILGSSTSDDQPVTTGTMPEPVLPDSSTMRVRTEATDELSSWYQTAWVPPLPSGRAAGSLRMLTFRRTAGSIRQP